MGDQQLIEYIKKEINAGFPISKIKNSLIKQGYAEKKVDQVIQYCTQKPSDSTSTTQLTPAINEHYFNKLLGVLFKPLTVLEQYKAEKGMKEPLKFLLISTGISAAITAISVLLDVQNIMNVLMETVFIIVLNLTSVFVLSGLFHLFVKLFKGKNPYAQTFKAFAYISALWIVGSLLTGLGNLVYVLNFLRIPLALWILILLGSCLKSYTELSTGKLIAIWALLIVSIGFLTIGILTLTLGSAILLMI